MNEKECKEDHLPVDEERDQTRRDFVKGLAKWSMVLVGTVLAAEGLTSERAHAGWSNHINHSNGRHTNKSYNHESKPELGPQAFGNSHYNWNNRGNFSNKTYMKDPEA